MSTQLKERPIILTAEEINAVLAGDKTQHRVPVLTAKEIGEGFEWDFSAEGDSAVCIKEIDDERQEVLLKPCPFGAEGDRLWVQEPSLIHCDWDWFYADNTLVECKEPFTSNDLHLPWDDEHQEYTGPIAAEYLPRWASRLLLEITDIRIERVKDISETDAKAMGLKPDYYYCDHKYQTCEDIGCIGKWAGALWLHLRIDKKFPVHHTAWVWVVEFKKVNN